MDYARLHRSFVRAINGSSLTRVQIAALAEYAAHDQLSRQINAKKIALTPLTLRRLRTIADVLAYEGDLFESERRRG